MRDIDEAHKLVMDAKRIAGFHALLHKFFDTAAEAVVIVFEDGTIVFFNRKASFLFGWLSEEVLGHEVEILVPDHLKLIHQSHRDGYVGDPYTRAMGANLDLMARHKSGNEFPVLIDLHAEMGADGIYVRAAIRRKGSDKEPPSEAAGESISSGCPFHPAEQP